MPEIVIPYTPRKLQTEFHENKSRFKVLCCHRRWGKTVGGINELIALAIEAKMNGKERPRFAYLAPLYRQAKQVAWDYLLYYTAPIPGRSINASELRVDFLDDCRIQLLGADNPDSHRGIYLDGVVMDEYAQMSPRVWNEIIRPALSDREGKAIFIGTPQGRNQFYDMYIRAEQLMSEGQDWYAVTHRASETGIINVSEMEQMKMEMTPEEYAQELECSWTAAIRGAYYGKMMQDAEQRITNVPWEPTIPVHTAWDLGMDDSTCIWFYQTVNREVRLIDFYEGSGVGLEHYVKHLKAQPYVYGDHWLPHDVKVRELGSGKSRLDTLRSLGVRGRVVPNCSIDDGISAVRNILPRCWFDKAKCARGVEALRLYRTEYDDKKKVYKMNPLHDWTSHAADSFRYLGISLKESQSKNARPAFANMRTANDNLDYGNNKQGLDYDPFGISY